MYPFNKKGIASLPTVIALSIFILVVSISILAVSFSESFVSTATRQSSKALYYAESGAMDALQKIIRNKNYNTISSYQLEFANNGCISNAGCAIISVSADNNPKIIIAEGRVNTIVRKVEVDVSFDSNGHGQIDSINWQELTN